MKLPVTLLTLLWLLTACSQNQHQDTVEFTAKTGDAARYWVQTSTNVQIGDSQSNFNTLGLLDYKVEQASADSVTLSVTPEYMEISGDNFSFSSATPSKRSQKRKLKQFFQAGFKLNLDPTTRQLKSFVANDQETWQELMEKSGEEIIDALQQSLNTPGFLQAIPTEVGAVVDLPEFNKHPVQMKVEKVTADHITLVINSDLKSTKQFGKVIISRDNGWLERLALVSTSPVTSYGMSGSAHNRLEMLRVTNGEPALLAGKRHEMEDTLPWIDIRDHDEDIKAHIEPTAEQLFKFSKGTFSHQSQLHTELLLTDQMVHAVGEVWFTDIKGRSSQDPALNVELAPSGPSWFDYTEEGVKAEQGLRPVGWLNRDDLNKVDQLTATAHYHPAQLKSFNVPWSPDQKVSHQMGSVTLTIEPVEGIKGEYAVNVFTNGTEYVMPIFSGIEGQYKYAAPDVGPEWLNTTDRYMTSLNQLKIQLKVTKASDNITFYVNDMQLQPAFSQSVEYSRN